MFGRRREHTQGSLHNNSNIVSASPLLDKVRREEGQVPHFRIQFHQHLFGNYHNELCVLSLEVSVVLDLLSCSTERDKVKCSAAAGGPVTLLSHC